MAGQGRGLATEIPGQGAINDPPAGTGIAGGLYSKYFFGTATAAVSSTRRVAYDILNQVAATRRVSYDLKNSVSATRRVVYAIDNPVSATRRVAYDIGTPAGGAARYRLLAGVGV